MWGIFFLAIDTEDLLNMLTYYHLQEFTSGRELIKALREDDYAKYLVALSRKGEPG